MRMPKPKISIILPVLNTRKYLPPRIESILSQSFQDWELIVVDSYSDDGSWELLKSLHTDNRAHLCQRERQGLYDAWNHGIAQAQGEYVYIATSDDTMQKDCLEKLLATLQRNPACGFAHCNLQIIDDNGKWLKDKWKKNFLAQKFYSDCLDVDHLRKAPLDGILLFGLGTIFHSITQLLIRKKVFNEIGFFSDQWGSAGDFEWGMKASLIFDSVHVPEYLATWRFYEGQATPAYPPADLFLRHIQMTASAVKCLKTRDPELYDKLHKHWPALQKINLLNHRQINQKLHFRNTVEKNFPEGSFLRDILLSISNFCAQQDILRKMNHMKKTTDKVLGDYREYIKTG